MATAPLPANDDHDDARDTDGDDELQEVFQRAQERFELSVLPQLEQRSLCLIARRFVNIPGAMWEGDFGEMFPDEVKLEIPLIKDGIDKIYRDYTQHRIVPDFKPSGTKGDPDSATDLGDIYRADAAYYGSDEAWDTAFKEGSEGGFGAYRLTTEYADPYDKDSDEQRINPGLPITDADQRVFFGPSDRYDKRDAPYAFVVTSHARLMFEEEHPDAISDWSVPKIDPPYDWYQPDVVKVAEYYEVQDVEEKLLIFTHRLSGEEQRFWDSEIDDGEVAEMKKLGWKLKTSSRKRKRVHKYLLSGEEVIEDCGLIVGDRIPIAPYYGNRAVVDGIERFQGYVQSKMDIQRLYNMAVSKLAETSAQSPREIPIFAAQQMPPHLAELWARQVVDRHSYAVVEPLVDPVSGSIISGGPIGKVEAPQVDANTTAVLQIARADLTEGQQDGADEVKANTSADAMEFAATRVDARSGIYLDNWRKTTAGGGEIYLGMANDTYFEPGRELETRTEEGSEGTAKLVQSYVGSNGVAGNRNDFSRGNYKAVVTVTEATATRRDKTVRSCLELTEMLAALDPEMAQAAAITAVSNMDGEGMDDLQKFARKKAIMSGLAEPTDEEKAELQQEMAGQQQQPDPAADLAAAKTQEALASAGQKKADALLKVAQAQAVGGPEAAPQVPDGLEAAHKAADIGVKAAQAEHIRQQTAHLPQELAIQATNAASNHIKAQASAHSSRFSALAKLFGGGKGQ